MFVLALFGSSAFGLEPGRLLTEYQHAVFTAREGAPADVHSLAQTPDGTLWLGTASGLYRFDGSVFEPVPTLGGVDIRTRAILALFVDPSGGLWLGYGGVGAGYYDSRTSIYRSFTTAEGWQTTESFLRDRDGGMWVVEGSHLSRIVGFKKESPGKAWGLPDSAAITAAMDARGTLWVSFLDDDVRYLVRGQHEFQRAVGFHPATIAVAPDGAVWGASTEGLVVLLTENGLPKHSMKMSRTGFEEIFFDRDGGIWLKGVKGLQHSGSSNELLAAGGVERMFGDSFGMADGMSSNAEWRMFEDAEGDVWMSTSAGLDRFRDTAFLPVRLPAPEHGFGVVAGSAGDVWSVNWDSPLFHVQGGKVTPVESVGPLSDALYRDPSGGVWAGGQFGIRHSRDGRTFDHMPVPERVANAKIQALTLGADGALWLGTNEDTATGRLVGGRWTSLEDVAGLPKDVHATGLFTDSRGRVWLVSGSRIYIIEGRSAQLLVADTFAAGLGSVGLFAPHGDDVWVVGADNVALFRAGGLHFLHDAVGQPFNAVTGIVQRANGDLWLHGMKQAIRLPAQQLDLWLKSTIDGVHADRLDTLDGLYGTSTRASIKPTLAEATDGRLWFSTSFGLASLNPDQIRRADHRPQAVIRSLEADGHALVGTDDTTLPALTRQLEINYTAPSLAFPERTRFRYRLDGLDTDWQEVGARRVAVYTRLEPGSYVFRVQATSRPDDWNGREVSFRIDVPPAWYQARWFHALCAVLVAALALALHRWRLRLVTARAGQLQAARAGERERVARDLHDTILQGFQGMVIKFSSLVEKMRPDDPVRAPMAHALGDCSEVLREGRDRVLDLRRTAEPDRLLSAELAAEGQRLLDTSGTVFDVTVVGDERPLKATVHHELALLMTEALRNASSHARARHVSLVIRHERSALVATLVDDGIGMDAETARNGRPAHWGLPGMRERARQIRANLELDSEPGRGTRVTVRMKGSNAW